MPKNLVTFDTVRQIALSLDDVEEGTAYGTPAFKVKGKLFARLHQDGESLVIRMGFDQRDHLMAANPETYFITDHYTDYEWMLVRLSKVKLDELKELIRIAWQARLPGKRAISKKSKTPASRRLSPAPRR